MIDGTDVTFHSGPFGDSGRQWHRVVEYLMSHREQGKRAWVVSREVPPWTVAIAADERPPLDQPGALFEEAQ